MTLHIRIEGTDLPGLSCAPGQTNIHVGVQRGREPHELVPGDAPSATWELDVTTKPGPDGTVDIGGPYAQGKRGDRFHYLTWGSVDPAGHFAMFRRAKLNIADIDPALLERAATGEATLVARLSLTDAKGLPVCARVRPPAITWSTSPD
jgi:hypothetical protein